MICINHSYILHPALLSPTVVVSREKLMRDCSSYLGRQFLSEMGLSQWKSLDFWSMVVIFILCWWIRLYLHYVAQYGFLRISNIPVIRSVKECMIRIHMDAYWLYATVHGLHVHTAPLRLSYIILWHQYYYDLY